MGHLFQIGARFLYGAPIRAFYPAKLGNEGLYKAISASLFRQNITHLSEWTLCQEAK
jgi:hypothetical protein